MQILRTLFLVLLLVSCASLSFTTYRASDLYDAPELVIEASEPNTALASEVPIAYDTPEDEVLSLLRCWSGGRLVFVHATRVGNLQIGSAGIFSLDGAGTIDVHSNADCVYAKNSTSEEVDAAFEELHEENQYRQILRREAIQHALP